MSSSVREASKYLLQEFLRAPNRSKPPAARLAKREWLNEELRLAEKNGLLSMFKTNPEEEEEEKKAKEACVANSLPVFRHHQEKHYDPAALIAALGAAGNKRDLLKGRQIHAELMGTGLLEKNVFVGTSVVSMYAKCCALAKARDALERLPTRNLITWNALIAGYAQHGYAKEAFLCFEKLKAEGFTPDSVTFLCVVKACISIKAIDWGQELHANIAAEGLLEKNVALSNALIDMYAKFELLNKAQEVFDKLSIQDLISWNVLILGYAQLGHGEEALICFETMQQRGFIPNAITFLNILKACVSLGNLEKGRELHAQIASHGLLQNNVVIGTALMDMYAKCGSLVEAQALFDELPERNLICWTALITAYVDNYHSQEAFDCFKNMQLAGHCPNAVTFMCVLKTCGFLEASDEGLKLHCQIVKVGLSECDVALGTALVDMYADCNMLPDAQNVFDKSGVQDVALWNALVAGYAQHGRSEEAFNCLKQMHSGGLVPNTATFACILKASASLVSVHRGKQIHSEITKLQPLGNKIISIALVHMYANCAMLQESQDIFDRAAVQDLDIWNVLIAGHAHLGKEGAVFDLFAKMQRLGIDPDEVTFTNLLNTCSHSGLFDAANMYFEIMRKHFTIIPIKEHHACYVDLFGRAGRVDEALAVVKLMPFHTCRMLWQIMLAACRNLGHLKLRRWAFEHAVQMDGKKGAAYISLANLYPVVMQVDACSELPSG